MSFLYTSTLRAIPSRIANQRRITSALRFASTDSSSEAGPSTTTTPPSDPSPSKASSAQTRRPLFPNFDLGTPPPQNPNAWWRIASEARTGIPNTPFSGRSYPVARFSDFIGTYRRLQRTIRETGLKSDIRRAEYYEKPTAKRVRLNSERHRRRFAADVRAKVHLVQTLQARN